MNFPLWIRAGFSLVALVLTSLSSASAVTETMDVDALERGMRGYGLTVFHGTRIDTFQVEVLGVQRNAIGPGSDMILVKLSGDPIEKTGGIAGMSGSPVYVDGKLIGAVAYGWSFSIDPIMGVTPIGEMLEIVDRPDGGSAGYGTDLGYEAPGERTSAGVDGARLQKVRTPVYLSGFVEEALPGLQDRLEAYGLMPVQGGGGVDSSLPDAPLAPGAAVGVQLVRGDFSMTGIGTVTHVDGLRVLGLGHPMLFSGSTRLPMTTAFIHDVLPSQFISFKLGAAVNTVGAITQDRSPGVLGLLGETVEMMPTTITVKSPGVSNRFEMEVLRNRELGPMVVQAAVVSALFASEKARGEATVRTELTVDVAGYEPMTFENVYAGARGLGEGVMGVTRPIQLLVQNPFETVRIDSASVSLEVAEDVQAAAVHSIALDRSTFEPGDRVGVTVELRPYLDEPVTRQVTMTIPDHVREGTLMLRVSSARSHAAQESKRVPAAYRVSTVDALVRALRREHRNDEMIVELIANRPGATVAGVELSALPPSVAAAMKTSRRSRTVRAVNQTVLSKAVTATDFVLSGQQTVYLKVGGDGPSLRFSPVQPGPTPKKK